MCASDSSNRPEASYLVSVVCHRLQLACGLDVSSFAPNQQDATSIDVLTASSFSLKGPTMEIPIRTQSLYRRLSTFDLAINH